MNWLIIVFGSFVVSSLAGLFIKGLGNSPLWLLQHSLAVFQRLWKESVWLQEVLYEDKHFTRWNPKRAQYVALRAIRVRNVVQETSQPVLESLDEFLRHARSVVMLGDPGAGKTSALQAMTYRLAWRARLCNYLVWIILLLGAALLLHVAPLLSLIWLASFFAWEPLLRWVLFMGRIRVPLFLEGRSDFQTGSVQECLEKKHKEHLGDKPLYSLCDRIAFLVDGVNEVQVNRYEEFMEGWRARTQDPHSPCVIFTSRAGEENPAPRFMINNVLMICDLDDKGVLDFLQVYGRDQTAQGEKAYTRDQAEADLGELRRKGLLDDRGMGRNPYWLQMIVERKLYTRNRSTLLSVSVEELIRRETKSMPEERKRKPDWQLVEHEMEMNALSHLALAMHQDGRIGFLDADGWQTACDKIRPSLLDTKCTPVDVLREAEAATLIRCDRTRGVEFVHQLIQEFFVAYAFRSATRWEIALDHSEDIWWWGALFLLDGVIEEHDATAYNAFIQKKLSHGSDVQRLFAAISQFQVTANLSLDLSSAAVGALIEPAEDKLTKVQLRAVQTLTRVFSEDVASAFVPLLDSQQSAIRRKGVEILGVVGGKHCAETLIKVLCDTAVQATVIEALVSMGMVAVRPLIDALASPETDLCQMASEVLARIEPSATDKLILALSDHNAKVREYAVDTLGRIGHRDVIKPLISMLGDLERNVRTHAAAALGNIGSAAVEPLVAALRDPQSKKSDVTIALAMIGSPAVELLITALLRASRWDVRWRAAETLGRIRDARAAEPLVRALSDRRWEVRRDSVNALASIGVPALPSLIRALHDIRPKTRRDAAEAIGKMGPAADVPLAEWSKSVQSERQIVRHIISLRWFESIISRLNRRRTQNHEETKEVSEAASAPIIQALVERLGDSNWEVRWRSAEALGMLHNPLAVAPLQRVLHDQYRPVSQAAVEALGGLGSSGIEPLLVALKDSKLRMRDQSARALRKLGAIAVEPLVALLRNNPPPDVRRHVVEVLGDIGDLRAEEALEAAKRDQDKKVRRTAEQVLRRMRSYQLPPEDRGHTQGHLFSETARRTVNLNGKDWQCAPSRLRGPDVTELDQIQSGSFPATVPGEVRLDWLDSKLPSRKPRVELPQAQRHQVIGQENWRDLYYERNNDNARWVEQIDWWYWRDFELTIGPGQRAWLRLNGADYYTWTYFNGTKLGEHEGMFSRQTYEITQTLRTHNRLAVRFMAPQHLPHNRSSWREKVLNFIENHFWGEKSCDPNRRDTLKCQMGYGWDFAPSLRTIGLWDDVELIVTGEVALFDVQVRTRVLPDHAQVTISFDVDADTPGPAEFELSLVGLNFKSDVTSCAFVRDLVVGRERVSYEMNVPGPRLWFPWDHGEPCLYELVLEVHRRGYAVDRITERVGLRQITWRRNPDSSLPASDWTCVVNGQPVYLRGATWVPADAFPGRVTKDIYVALLAKMREANLNALRVWGGGLREKKAFYDLCDELGLLVWQEFPLACTFVTRHPRSSEYMLLVERETSEIVRQLRDHPSVMIWCGGNEFNSNRNRPVVEAMRRAVLEEDGTRRFHEVSPSGGDSHNWLIWHGHHPFEDYERDLAQITSEFGLQAPPVIESLKGFIPSKRLWPPRQIWRYHRAQMNKLWYYAVPFLHLGGLFRVLGIPYLVSLFRAPVTLEGFVFASQRAQARGIQIAVEHARRRKYKTSGFMVWQFNSPWPAIDWSLLDYYHQPKLAYNQLTQSANPLLVSLEYPLKRYAVGDKFSAQVYVINDWPHGFADCCAEVTFQGECRVFKIDLEPDSAQSIGILECQIHSDDLKVVCRLTQHEKELSKNHYDLAEYDGRLSPWQGIIFLAKRGISAMSFLTVFRRLRDRIMRVRESE